MIKDEVAFYQAEVQNLSRENQILKARIRELGKWFFQSTIFTDMLIPI